MLPILGSQIINGNLDTLFEGLEVHCQLTVQFCIGFLLKFPSCSGSEPVRKHTGKKASGILCQLEQKAFTCSERIILDFTFGQNFPSKMMMNINALDNEKRELVHPKLIGTKFHDSIGSTYNDVKKFVYLQILCFMI